METRKEFRFPAGRRITRGWRGQDRWLCGNFWGRESPLGPSGFTEKIRRGAIAESMTGDVIALYNHDPANLLARTTAGTMSLAEDSVGLKTEINLPPTTLGRDIYELVKRSDLRGMSLGFHVTRDSWNTKHTERELLAIDLHEVSIVARPAYPQTTIEARSLGLPDDVELLTYPGVLAVTSEERDRLRLRLSLLRRL
jgi:Escherichia/Staphylococcus phage prohead protease